MVGFGLVLVANWGWALAMSRFNLQLTEQPNPLPYFGGGVTGLLMALLLGAVVAPVAEEIFSAAFSTLVCGAPGARAGRCWPPPRSLP